jgi:hypothetical protein
MRHAVTPSSAESVLDHITPGADIIVPIANGEPVRLLDALEANNAVLDRVRIHQMHVLHDRVYLHGMLRPHLSHVSYFLSHVTREPFRHEQLDLAPANFSEVPRMLRQHTRCSLVLAAAAPMDRHGYFSLGTSADYTASFIGRVPFFLEVNPAMPRTHGRNQVHASQVVGVVDAEYPLVEATPPAVTETDCTIAGFVAERILDRSTIQAGIGAIPNAILASLVDHEHLGLHTELVSDGVIGLVESGALTGAHKTLNPGKMVTTFVLGTGRTYDFVNDNTAVELWPVDYVNDPRVIGQEQRFVSINATLEVDLLVGQRRPGRLRTWRDVLAGGPGVRRPPLHREGRHDLPHRVAARSGAGGHDPEEHRRQGRHRMGRGRAAGAQHPRAGPLPHPHRPPRAPRPPRPGSEGARVRLNPSSLRPRVWLPSGGGDDQPPPSAVSVEPPSSSVLTDTVRAPGERS